MQLMKQCERSGEGERGVGVKWVVIHFHSANQSLSISTSLSHHFVDVHDDCIIYNFLHQWYFFRLRHYCIKTKALVIMHHYYMLNQGYIINSIE